MVMLMLISEGIVVLRKYHAECLEYNTPREVYFIVVTIITEDTIKCN